MSPEVSIIIPVYNAEKTLHRCLDSIRNQSFQDWECLLIDDGSNDTSGLICDNYAASDSRFRVFHKENGGVSSARNLGLENAIAQWICFVDADDWIDNSFLSELDSSYDLYLHNWRPFKHIATYVDFPISKVKGDEYDKFLAQYKSSFVFYVPWAKLYKRSIIIDNNIRFDSRFRFGEDTLFVFEYISKCSSIQVLGNGFYNYLPNIEWKTKYRCSPCTAYEYLEKYYVISKATPLYSPKSIYKQACMYFYLSSFGDNGLFNKIQWFSSPNLITTNRHLVFKCGGIKVSLFLLFCSLISLLKR